MTIDNRLLVPAAVVLGLVLIGVSLIYFLEPAKSLPFPDFLGHESGVRGGRAGASPHVADLY